MNSESPMFYLVQCHNPVVHYVVEENKILNDVDSLEIGSRVEFFFGTTIQRGFLYARSTDKEYLSNVSNKQLILVQYSSHGADFIHRIIRTEDILNIIDDDKFLICVDGQKHVAKALHICDFDQKEQIMEQFQQFKINLTGNVQLDTFSSDEWMLVEYRTSSECLHHCVIKCDDRIWKSQYGNDLVKDVFRFWCDPFHKVIKKSKNRDALIEDLEAIRGLIANIPFPLTIIYTNGHSDEYYGSMSEEEARAEMEALFEMQMAEKEQKTEAKLKFVDGLERAIMNGDVSLDMI